MKKWTLRDLKKRDGKYAFPDSNFTYSKKSAQNILKILNWNGSKILTPTVSPSLFVKLIDEIEELKKKV